MPRPTKIKLAQKKKDLESILWDMLIWEYTAAKEGNPKRFGGNAITGIIKALQDERTKTKTVDDDDKYLAEIIKWSKEE